MYISLSIHIYVYIYIYIYIYIENDSFKPLAHISVRCEVPIRQECNYNRTQLEMSPIGNEPNRKRAMRTPYPVNMI